MKAPLKYLFQVQWKDGTTFFQTPEDESRVHAGRSCYTDVFLRLDEVEHFALVNQETGQTALVAMDDGHFEVNGVPFYLTNDPDVKGFKLVFRDFKLVYFRDHRVEQQITCRVNEKIEAEITEARETGHVIAYRMGWEAVDAKGQRVEKTIWLM